MRIEELQIETFRGIRFMRLPLHQSLNVLVGVNGAGKSSVLDCIAILLSQLAGRIRGGVGNRRELSQSDIRQGAGFTRAALKVAIGDRTYQWDVMRAWHRSSRRSKPVADLLGLTAALQDDEASAAAAQIPLAVLYGVSRAVLDVPLRIRTRHAFGPWSAWDQALSGTRSDFRLFFEWYREREDIENEMLRYGPSGKDAGGSADLLNGQDPQRYGPSGKDAGGSADLVNGQDPQLRAVRQAIQDFTGFSSLRVRRNPLRMEAQKDGVALDIRQFSDGEKCLLALVGDLARRLAIANPGLSDALTGEAIVLIDEIDLHLHPAWQRLVIPRLAATFPQCQFVISTHSPQVLSHVPPECIFLLKPTPGGIEAVRVLQSFGLTSDRILEDLMGVSARPPDIEQDLQRLFIVIDQGNLPAAKETVAAIRQKIGEDPELVKADVLIRRRELIGR